MSEADEIQALVDERDRLAKALTTARQELHRACLQLGSTEGYAETFRKINAALDPTKDTSA